MRILGIDPGLAVVGYGLVEYNGNNIKMLEYGVIKTPANSPIPKRLGTIYREINQIISDYQPEEAAIEELFFSKNVKSAIDVSQARGVAVLACENNGLDIYEYTPLQVKKNVVGFGRADKQQVQEMVRMILNLTNLPSPVDASDALALAICQCNTGKFRTEFRMR